jgi:CheY-like chemotaxis protein
MAQEAAAGPLPLQPCLQPPLQLLLVDDEILIHRVTKMIFRGLNVHITEAVDGAAALRLFRSKEAVFFDCILMDCSMPLMDGFECARQIRALERERLEQAHSGSPGTKQKKNKNTPIVGHTANIVTTRYAAACIAAGMDMVVCKGSAKLCQIIMNIAEPNGTGR